MRVAIYCPKGDIPLVKITKALCKGLETLGVRADWVTTVEELPYKKYDLLHFTNLFCALDVHIRIPITAGVYHVKQESLNKFSKLIERFKPRILITSDSYTQRQLGDMGTITRYCPFAFDHTGFKSLPYPKEFTVGSLQRAGPNKRTNIIKQATEELDIPYKELVTRGA